MKIEQPTQDVESLTQCLRENADDNRLADMLIDALQEMGVSDKTARSTVQSIRLMCGWTDLVGRAGAAVAEQTRRGRRLRVYIYVSASIYSHSHRRIEIIPGESRPVGIGEAGYSTLPNGQRVTNSRAAMSSGYTLTYHPSTLAVQVGAEWVEAACLGHHEGWVYCRAGNRNDVKADSVLTSSMRMDNGERVMVREVESSDAGDGERAVQRA